MAGGGFNAGVADWPHGGKVHQGFKDALEEVWLDLLPYIKQLDSKGRKIWMTGHSLGAALATLCASRYGNVQQVYAFGCPRIGNDVFRDKLDVKIYRIVNNDDIVARVPPPGAYVHVGELKFIDEDGILQDHVTEREPAEVKRPDESYGQENNDMQNSNAFAGFVPAPFRDHVPLLYAVHLWNNLIENKKKDTD